MHNLLAGFFFPKKERKSTNLAFKIMLFIIIIIIIINVGVRANLYAS